MFLSQFAESLLEEPAFTDFYLTDRNPLGGVSKKRRLSKPNDAMRMLHTRLRTYLRPCVRRFPCATGGVPKSSPRVNAGRHRYNRYFFLTDLQSAYQNVDGRKLAEILCGLDPYPSENTAEMFQFLERYCLDPQGGLVVGAPASPDLFNIYAGVLLDGPLTALREQYQLTYSRYLDDLAFSSRTEPIGKVKRKKLRSVITAAGFSISDHKTQVLDLAKGPVIITGVGVEFGGRIFLPRHYLRTIRGLIHLTMRTGEVPEHTIHGMMGVFWSSSHRHNLNRTETKLLRAYRQYQRFLRGR